MQMYVGPHNVAVESLGLSPYAALLPKQVLPRGLQISYTFLSSLACVKIWTHDHLA